MHIELDEFASALIADEESLTDEVLPHAIVGLVDLGLIEDTYVMGGRDSMPVIYLEAKIPHSTKF
jgi:hypothetical protein